MADKDFTFIEDTKDDNGYDWFSGVLRFGEVDVSSVEEMVDHILNNLEDGDCIGDITIIGHGAPGTISVGNGQSGTDKSKDIGLWNRAQWTAQLGRLHCRFCDTSRVYLRGCNVGADEEGAQLLFEIQQVLGCAAVVQAPAGVCYPAHTTGDDQESKKGDSRKPSAIANPAAKGKKKKKANKTSSVGSKIRLLSGTSPESIKAFAARQITSARYLPAYPDHPFGVGHLQSGQAKNIGRRLLGRLIGELEQVEPLSMGSAAFKVQALIQLQILDDDGQVRWLAPWSMMGNGSYLSVLGCDTRLVYQVPRHLADKLRKHHRRQMDQIFTETAVISDPGTTPAASEPEPVVVEAVSPAPASEDRQTVEGKEIVDIEGISSGNARRLADAGIRNMQDLAHVDVSIAEIPGISGIRLEQWKAQAHLQLAFPEIDSNGIELIVRGLNISSSATLLKRARRIRLADLKRGATSVKLPDEYDLGALLVQIRYAGRNI